MTPSPTPWQKQEQKTPQPNCKTSESLKLCSAVCIANLLVIQNTDYIKHLIYSFAFFFFFRQFDCLVAFFWDLFFFTLYLLNHGETLQKKDAQVKKNPLNMQSYSKIVALRHFAFFWPVPRS